MKYVLIATLLFAPLSLFCIVKELSDQEKMRISKLAICAITTENDRRIPQALQDARGNYTNFVVRLGFNVRCDIVPLKTFDNEKDVLALLNLPGEETDVPPCPFRLRVRTVTWYYVLQTFAENNSLVDKKEVITMVPYIDAPLKFLQLQCQPTIILPPTTRQNHQEHPTKPNKTSSVAVECDDDWIMVEKPSKTTEPE